TCRETRSDAHRLLVERGHWNEHSRTDTVRQLPWPSSGFGRRWSRRDGTDAGPEIVRRATPAPISANRRNPRPAVPTHYSSLITHPRVTRAPGDAPIRARVAGAPLPGLSTI